MELAIVIAVVVVALVFDYTNGFHDAANAIATSVSTRALTPRVALILAAVMNFVGALLGQEVAKTVRATIITDGVSSNHGLVDRAGRAARRDHVEPHHLVLRPAVVVLARPDRRAGRRRRSPAASTVDWNTIIDKVVIPMVVSPVVGFCAGVPADAVDHVDLPETEPAAGHPQLPAAADASPPPALALGHGLQDAQKTMGVIFLALITAGYYSADGRPPAAVGRDLRPPPRSRSAPTPAAGGSCAPWAAGSSTSTPPAASPPRRSAPRVLYTTAFVFHAPISTTHTITSAIMGAGATKRFSAVRWGVARSIVTAWMLTFPMAGLVAAALLPRLVSSSCPALGLLRTARRRR